MTTAIKIFHAVGRRILNAVLMLAAAIAAPIGASAQTDAQLTQYFEVPTFYNPAAVGSSEMLRIRGGARLQWVGIENAPTTFLGLADTKLKVLNKFVGLGAVLQSDSYGLFGNITASLQLGYKLKLLNGELTIGLQPGVFIESFNGSKVYIPDDDDYHTSTDEGIPTNDVSGTVFDLGAGLWYNHRLFWGGLSCTHVTSPTVKLSTKSSTSSSSESASSYQYDARRTLYFMAGSNIPIKNTLFEVMPSVLVKTDFDFFGAEATARVRYNKFLTAGLAYRYDDAFSILLGIEYKGILLGYSYDYATSAISKASSGSHEIIAGYSLKLDLTDKNKNKHKSIRIL